MEEKKKIKELDLIRVISALFIALYHYTTRYEMAVGHLDKNYFLDVKYGYMAVAVFFILTGFLLVNKFDKEISALKFYIKKFFRIYPSYLVAMILTTIVIFLAGSPFADRLCSVKDWILNLFILTQYLGIQQVDGVYWTLTIEVTFYIIMGIVILLKQNKNINMWLFVWIVASLSLNVISLFYNHMIIKAIKILAIANYSQLFIIGMVICLMYKGNKKYYNYIILLLCMVNQYLSLGIEYTIFLFVFTVLFYLIIMKIVKLPKKLCDNKIVENLAGLSYPFYLTHQFIGFVIIYYLEHLGLTSSFGIVIPILIMVGVAYLIHRYVEKPLINCGSKLISRIHK